MDTKPLGLHAHRGVMVSLLLQVLLVGWTLGLMRTVVPVMAEADFGVPRGSFLLITAFVVAFGLVKGTLNFIAGRWSDRIGRRRVLMTGWLVALPVPWMLWAAPHWGWVVAATVLLGVHQGLTWSMSQTAKLDLTLPHERGLTLGLNEFAGYAGVALAGWVTARVAEALGTRESLLVCGLMVVGTGLMMAVFTVPETRSSGGDASTASGTAVPARAWDVFMLTTWRDKRLAALCQAGAVEKWVDALVWVFYPVYLVQQGLTLTQAAAVIGVYGMTWGLAQLLTGRLSDRWGRQGLNVSGMVVCGGGVALMLVGQGVVWWSWSAAISGLGMAMLYPNLSAAVADLTEASLRGTAIGTYRFWRDQGYALGALAMGAVAHWGGHLEAAFVCVSMAMLASAAVLWIWGEETHPGRRPPRFHSKPQETP